MRRPRLGQCGKKELVGGKEKSVLAAGSQYDLFLVLVSELGKAKKVMTTIKIFFLESIISCFYNYSQSSKMHHLTLWCSLVDWKLMSTPF